MSNNDMEKLYRQYKPFLNKLCRRYINFCEMDDLLQMAYIGLHNAVSTFKEDAGASFMHYLSVCVKRTILRELENTGAIIRIPVHVQAKIRKYKQARQELTNDLFRQPFSHEIAEKLQIPLWDITEIEKVINLQSVASLDAPIGDDDGDSLSDIIADTVMEDAEVKAERQELRRLLWIAAKNCLDDDLLKFIYEYFHEEITLAELADRSGTSAEPLRNNLRRGIGRLRNDRRIRQLGVDYGYVGHYHHVTLSEYKYTWTSSVENEVLRREEHRERISSKTGLNIERFDPFSTISGCKQEGKVFE